MIPIGIGLLAFGYAVTYYAVNVLAWAHGGADPHRRPVPFKYCLGLAIDPKGAPAWMPIFNMESATLPGDAMGGGGQSQSMGGQLSQGLATDPQLRDALKKKFPTATPQQLDDMQRQIQQNIQGFGDNLQGQLNGGTVGPFLGGILPNPFNI